MDVGFYTFAGAIFLVFGGGIMGYFLNDDYDNNFFPSGLIGSIVVLIGAVLIACLARYSRGKIESLEEQVEKAEKVFYYDGFEVNVEVVNLHEFNIVYDSEKNIYTLIRKEEP